MTQAVDVRDAFRIYGSEGRATAALQGLTLAVDPGEIVAVLGPSGSGKTTLLRALAGFEQLSAGSVTVLGTDLGALGDAARAAFRAENVGFLDQHYAQALSPDLTCRETVALQLELAGRSPADAGAVAETLLARVGLSDRAGDRPQRLSGGEQQRVAVCAAVAHRPKLLLADEPVGELDAESAATIYRLLAEITRETGATAVIVTHDTAAASIADRLAHIRDGRLVEQSVDGGPRALVVSSSGWLRLPDGLIGGDAPSLVSAERQGSRVVLRPVEPRDSNGASAAEIRETAPVSPVEDRVTAELLGVTKRYRGSRGDRIVFSDLSHRFAAGRMTAVVGRSGTGKTTLLHLLAGLERPDRGEVHVAGESLAGRSRSELAALRRERIGLVTQEPGLVPYLSARENVLLALGIRHVPNGPQRAASALEEVGLGGQLDQRASTLSAGERQRVAIARALAADVDLLLVDEPTARLDEGNGRITGSLLARAAGERGIAVVCATHDPVLVELSADVLHLEPEAGSRPRTAASLQA
jgi:ABC-type lipoprotein export system ATPase subunit